MTAVTASQAVSPHLLRIGTAGWSVPLPHGERVPGGGSHLERYARTLNAAEINSSFHKPHQRKTYERWAQATPPAFRFAVKVPKTMTHERRLKDCGELLDTFAEQAKGLGEKLAVLLVQMPPKAEFDADATAIFIDELRGRFDADIVAEPRHASWFTPDVDAWLSKRKIARVAADPAKNPGAGEAGGWRGLAYYRWHGSPRMYYSEYDTATIEALRTKMVAHRDAGVPAWCMFDNTASGAALGNALDLAQTLSLP